MLDHPGFDKPWGLSKILYRDEKMLFTQKSFNTEKVR